MTNKTSPFKIDTRAQKIEVILVLVAAVLLIWAIVRTMQSGDSRPIFIIIIMAALLLLTVYNIFLRLKAIGMTIFVTCGLFISLLATSVWLNQTHGKPMPLFPVMRAILYLTLLGSAGWMQQHWAWSPAHAQPVPAPVDTATKWFGVGVLCLVVLSFLFRQWWMLIFFWPTLLLTPSLSRTMGWSGESGMRGRMKQRRTRRQAELMERMAKPPPQKPGRNG